VENKGREEEEVEALCPECGHAFKTFMDRVIPPAGETEEEQPVECPVCGCGNCTIGK